MLIGDCIFHFHEKRREVGFNEKSAISSRLASISPCDGEENSKKIKKLSPKAIVIERDREWNSESSVGTISN
jgi:hypothetical protein